MDGSDTPLTANLMAGKVCITGTLWKWCDCKIKDQNGNVIYKNRVTNSEGVRECKNHNARNGRPWFGSNCSPHNGDALGWGAGWYFKKNGSQCVQVRTHAYYQNCTMGGPQVSIDVDEANVVFE